MKNILGISAYYHDSAACLLINGDIIAAAQEERFTRKKHDPSFPINSIKFCLKKANIAINQIDAIVFYDKPILSFDRLLETYFTYAPNGLRSFLKSMPVWLKEKLFIKKVIKQNLQKEFFLSNSSKIPEIYFNEHHQSHAASSFYPSSFNEAAILCLDGVGEWATTSAWHGKGKDLDPLWEIKFPHSLGLLYSAFTYYIGFKVNAGEYKVMGLAPYGKPIYVNKIYDHLYDLKADGTFRLNMDYFNYCAGLEMTNENFNKLFGGSPRKPEGQLTQKEMDLARSIQEVTEETVSRLVKTLKKEVAVDNLCMAGGVALNCVANGRLLDEKIFKNIWIQPAAGDAGGCIGAAYTFWHQYLEKPRLIAKNNQSDAMKGSFLGPEYNDEEVLNFLRQNQVIFQYYSDENLFETVAQELADEKVVGWLQGPMEFGPRSLGSRSILGDARSTKMQSVMNLKIKHRESFRPFAPSILKEKANDYFDLYCDSPYMLLVAKVKESIKLDISDADKEKWGIDLLNIPKSKIPAVTHVDYSARIQTVHKETNPRYYKLIEEFEKKTGCPLIVNTSFNVRGEPIVCSPEDAFRCFMRTEIDTLVLQNYIIRKADQPKVVTDKKWHEEFELD
jgi:carbamoyltransferase